MDGWMSGWLWGNFLCARDNTNERFLEIRRVE